MWRVWGLALVAGCGRIGYDLETDARPIDAVPCTIGPFSAPQLEPNVNLFGMSQNEWAPAISGDDLTLYFYAGRGGPADIFSSTRATPTATFGAPVAIAEVSSTMTDTHPRVTSDGLVMLLASDRGGNSDR